MGFRLVIKVNIEKCIGNVNLVLKMLKINTSLFTCWQHLLYNRKKYLLLLLALFTGLAGDYGISGHGV